jgi:hypothetical protein
MPLAHPQAWIGRIASYKNEPLPVDVYDELLNLIDETSANLKIELAKNPSYAAGAQLLRKLIDDKKAKNRLREEDRPTPNGKPVSMIIEGPTTAVGP